MTQTTDLVACCPDDVVITRELETRPSRAPDHEGENRALRALAEAISTAPDTVLQQLAELAMALTRSDSSGISLLETGDANGNFRWVATAGAWSPYCNGTMPREASPCGEVIAQRSILLMKDPARAFPALLQAEPGAGEALLAPFSVGGVPAGTIWVIKHGLDEHFEAEDARLLESLAGFASAAHQTVQALRMAESAGQQAGARLEQLVTLADVSSEFFGTCDMDFMPTYGNAAAMRMVGLTDLEQVKRTPLSEFFFPEDLAFINDEFFPRVLREGHGKTEIRFRHFVTGEPVWVDYSLVVLNDAMGRPTGLGTVTYDLTERKRIEAALRESEERQAFLLTLSDALRRLADPEEIQFTATRLLGERLTVTRVFYFNVESDGDSFFLKRDYTNGVPSVTGQFSISQFDSYLAESWRSGLTVLSQDVLSDQRYSPEQLAAFDATQARAWLGIPLVKAGRLGAVMGVSHIAPRAWTKLEIALAEDVAERTWAAVERAIAEAALRESEDRYRTLFGAVDSGFCIIEMIFDEDGRATDYRFIEANPALERQSGLVDVVGRRVREFAPDLEEHWFERYGRVALTGESLSVEGEVVPLGRWFDINAFRVGAPEQHRVAVLFTDITDRMRAEAALRASQQQFEIVVNQAPLGIYLVDGDFVIRQVNPIALPVFGDIEGGAVGRDFDEVIHILWDKEYADEVVGIFQNTLETGEPYITAERAEYRIDRDLTEYYEWRIDRIILPNGKHGVVCYFRDISAQVYARQEIEEQRELARGSEERFRSVSEAMDDVFYMTDLDQGALLYLSPSFERIWGMPPTEMLRDLAKFVDSIHPDDRSAAIAAMAVQQQGQPAEAEYRIVRPDGEIRWIHDRCFPVPGSGRHRSAGVASDVTTRKAAEAALRDSEALFRQFNEFSSDVIWIRDAKTMQFEYVSPAIETVYGVAPEEFAARHNDLEAWAEILHPDDRAHALDGFRRVRAGERVTHEFRIQRPDGELRWIRDTDFPLIDDEGRVQRVAGIGQDITEIRRGDERQKTLLAELQHRVRNILAMIRSVTVRSAETAESVEDYCQHLEGRIGTMARTQSLLTRHVGSGVDLQNMILDELDAQAAPHTRFLVTGPDVMLPAKAAEVLALAVHELATNAVKYGAFDKKGGSVDVRWAVLAGDPIPKLSFIWSESGVRIDTPPTHRGFGTELITERVPYELRGMGNLEFRNGGLVATIEFPLIESISILQTDPSQFNGTS